MNLLSVGMGSKFNLLIGFNLYTGMFTGKNTNLGVDFTLSRETWQTVVKVGALILLKRSVPMGTGGSAIRVVPPRPIMFKPTPL